MVTYAEKYTFLHIKLSIMIMALNSRKKQFRLNSLTCRWGLAPSRPPYFVAPQILTPLCVFMFVTSDIPNHILVQIYSYRIVNNIGNTHVCLKWCETVGMFQFLQARLCKGPWSYLTRETRALAQGWFQSGWKDKMVTDRNSLVVS